MIRRLFAEHDSGLTNIEAYLFTAHDFVARVLCAIFTGHQPRRYEMHRDLLRCWCGMWTRNFSPRIKERGKVGF